jgi:aspartate racemase
MKKFGLLGGLSWLSTIDYYRELNMAVNQHFKSNINPRLYVVNLNQKEIHDLQKAGDWQKISHILIKTGRELESLGCEGLAFCANTPHRVYEDVQDKMDIPILHIGDAVGRYIRKIGHKKVGLLGTRYTMEGDFIRSRLENLYSVEVVIPEQEPRRNIQTLLYQEMSRGLFSDEARNYFLQLIEELKSKGAEAAVLGCTEFPILLNHIDTALPKIDSMMCHVDDIAKFILEQEQ